MRSRIRIALLGGLVLGLVGAALPAPAHDSQFSALHLRVIGARLEGTWEIHLSDARIALGLDGAVQGEPGWRELRDREPALRALLRAGLRLRSGAGACSVELAPGFEQTPGERPIARFQLQAVCPDSVAKLAIHYDLLADLDPNHRGYFTVADARLTHVGVFGRDQRSVALDIHRLDRWRIFRDYTREGIWHIWTGFDHALFLLALLLAAPLQRGRTGWRPRGGLWPVAREVTKVVTAFTLAHSLTLVLSVLDLVRLPARGVEVSIALSVWVAAWNNLRPFLGGRGWWLALGFGLVHGLGFASALEQLGLPLQARGLALLAFNVGVEGGQLAIVAVVLPVLYAASQRPGYVRGWLGGCSFAIAWISAIWLVERLIGFRVLPSL